MQAYGKHCNQQLQQRQPHAGEVRQEGPQQQGHQASHKAIGAHNLRKGYADHLLIVVRRGGCSACVHV